MRRAPALFVSAVLATTMLLSSCSGDDDESSSPTSTTAAAQTATTLTDSPYCQTLQRFNERYGRVDPSLADPARFKTAMEDALASAKEAEASAPQAIKADLATLNAGLQDLFDLFQGVGFDVTKLNVSDLDRLQGTPQLEAASQRVEAYTRDNCT
ncbi:MAG: hypothetical protein M3179_11110 [Actinomycetota bacterium]|nr:hypothetical protein [Actinomycetota bacterium]